MERQWYFELLEFLLVMLILGCMCRIVWIDIYVCVKKKTYKHCSVYLYLAKLHICRGEWRREYTPQRVPTVGTSRLIRKRNQVKFF